MALQKNGYKAEKWNLHTKHQKDIHLMILMGLDDLGAIYTKEKTGDLNGGYYTYRVTSPWHNE